MAQINLKALESYEKLTTVGVLRLMRHRKHLQEQLIGLSGRIERIEALLKRHGVKFKGDMVWHDEKWHVV